MSAPRSANNPPASPAARWVAAPLSPEPPEGGRGVAEPAGAADVAADVVDAPGFTLSADLPPALDCDLAASAAAPATADAAVLCVPDDGAVWADLAEAASVAATGFLGSRISTSVALRSIIADGFCDAPPEPAPALVPAAAAPPAPPLTGPLFDPSLLLAMESHFLARGAGTLHTPRLGLPSEFYAQRLARKPVDTH